MLYSTLYDQEKDSKRTKDSSQSQGSDSGSGDAQISQILAQDESGFAITAEELPEVYEDEREPYFPTYDEAVDLNKEAHSLYGQKSWGGVRDKGVLDAAINSAKQHYYYGPEEDEGERLAVAAAKMAWNIAGGQTFVDGNKRTAIGLTRHFLDQNGLGHVAPYDHDDAELADHLVYQDAYQTAAKSPEELQAERAKLENGFIDMFRNRYYQGGPNPEYEQRFPNGTYLTNPAEALPPEQVDRTSQRKANILDEIHDDLDPRVWDDPASPEPKLKVEHSEYIYEKIFTTLEDHGYDGMEKWLSLVLTGSLTTYQYSDDSDVDISLFVDTANFPEWSRAEMIVIMIHNVDGTTLPGTPFPLQDFVVPPDIQKTDLYKPGLRSGYDLATNKWIVPPEKGRVHDVENEMNESYTVALENADKMESLLRYEPDKAIQFWHQLHKRRQRDMKKGRGDYAPSNVTYKMLANRGLFPEISDVSGEYIA